MHLQERRLPAGRHRKQSRTSAARRRLILATLTAGAVSSAGIGSAAAQTLPAGSSVTAEQIVNTVASQVQALPAQLNGGVVKPAQGTFTSGYGMRWGTMHNGIDIANAIGTPILAVMDGTVINSGPASGFGQWIRIKHDDGSMSVYGHMETLNVNVGERVSAGQTIAGMGSRGFSTGSHLHFEIHPTGDGAVDPVSWFANHGIYI
ncbi:M23 family metallopeptidase [Corynebacterium alimapuense]|uniref:M23 family peptidase n=1 Tax=Corynebacterium alimapuense TaxID=1576874 RepID=A0A3M8K4N9_9CORY|nr:M23 family metallopeptidase [Corynebacterium alimapuense]RNE48156.1 M23 family peptidase [Corynebacterium alimapuense]